MSEKSKYPMKRLSIDIPQELYDRLWACFEWGERNRVLTRVLEWLCEKIETHGKQALVVILREDSFEELLKLGSRKSSEED